MLAISNLMKPLVVAGAVAASIAAAPIAAAGTFAADPGMTGTAPSHVVFNDDPGGGGCAPTVTAGLAASSGALTASQAAKAACRVSAHG